MIAQQNLKIQYKKYVKSRLTAVRFLGLFMSLLTFAMILLQYFNVLRSLWNSVSILYLCGAMFTITAQYQDLRLSKGWAKACRIIAAFFYILTIAPLVLIILGYAGVVPLTTI